MQSFGEDIKNGIVTMNSVSLNMVNDEQIQLAKSIKEILSNTKPRNLNMKKEKDNIKNNAMAFLKGIEMVYNVFESGIFYYLQIIILTNQNNQNNQNNQLIIINIFHQNQIIQIYQIAHHKIIVSATQTTYYLHQQEQEEGQKY